MVIFLFNTLILFAMAILMTKEYWQNSYFSVVRHSGEIRINGEDYSVVDKFGNTARELSIRAPKGQVEIIPPGEPCDLVQNKWIPMYKLLGRDKFIKYLEQAELPTIEDAKKFVKESS